jgi:hypothetical protein
MPFEDDDDDLDDLSDEEKEEIEKEMKEEREKLRKDPLLRQANEILKIVDALLDTCNDREVANRYGPTMQESAMIIVAKLHGSLGSDNYVLCMQKAAIIRDHAEYLRLSNHTLNSSEAFDKKYVKMFRDEMEIFRSLFKDRAKEIHRMENDFEDEWGLFLK